MASLPANFAPLGHFKGGLWTLAKQEHTQMSAGSKPKFALGDCFAPYGACINRHRIKKCQPDTFGPKFEILVFDLNWNLFEFKSDENRRR